jgi:outer membrane protein assembly factor BamB
MKEIGINMKILVLIYSTFMLVAQQACKKPAPAITPIKTSISNSYFNDTLVPVVWETNKDILNRFQDTRDIHYANQKIYTTGNLKIESYNSFDGILFGTNLINDIGDVSQFGITTRNTLVARGSSNYGIYEFPSLNLIRKYSEVGTFTSCNNYYYDNPNLTYRFYSNNDDSSANISIIKNGIEIIIFRDTTLWKDNYIAALQTYFWSKPNGDSCLIISPSLLERQGGNKNHTAVCIYNLKTKIVEWSLIDFDISGLGGALTVEGNKFYCNGPRHLYCYDLISHQKLWEYDFRIEDPVFGGFGYADNSPIFFDNDKMYIHSSGDWAYCFNKITGQTIWKTKAGGQPGNKHEYNGIIYFRGIQFNKRTGASTSDIVGIRKTDGKVVVSTRSPEAIRTESRSFTDFRSNGLALDPTKGWLFALTPNQMVCLDISKFQ